MDKRKYVVVHSTSHRDFDKQINELHGNGYVLTHFEVSYDADTLRSVSGVMELPAPTRINLEPVVSQG